MDFDYIKEINKLKQLQDAMKNPEYETVENPEMQKVVKHITSIDGNVSEINAEVSKLRKQVEILKQDLSDERKRAEEAEKKAQNVSHGSAALIAVFSSLIGYSLPIFIDWFKSLLQ